jgi:hypothetical protein
MQGFGSIPDSTFDTQFPEHSLVNRKRSGVKL